MEVRAVALQNVRRYVSHVNENKVDINELPT